MLSMFDEANKDVLFAVKTPNGITLSGSIKNKILQGDVMAPLMSRNFVDVNTVKNAIKQGMCTCTKTKWLFLH